MKKILTTLLCAAVFGISFTASTLIANDFYTPSGWPATGSSGSSASARGEMALIEAGFDKLPTLTGNGDEVVKINAGGTALESVPQLAHEQGGLEFDASSVADGDLIVGTGAGTMALRAGALTAGAAGFLTHEAGGLEFNASAVADGDFIVGTGTGTMGLESGATARTSLGVAIGSDVQAWGAVLDDFNTLGAAASDGQFIVATGAGAFAYESGATARTSLGLVAGGAGDIWLEKAGDNMTGNLTISRIAPQLFFDETDASADNGTWALLADAEKFQLRAFNDALSVATNFMEVERTGTTIDSVAFPNGNVLVGTTTAATGNPKVDIVDIESLTISNVTTDATAKQSYISGRHLTNAEEPVTIIGFNSQPGGENVIRYGGGLASNNAATIHEFYAAANNTTVTGTVVATIHDEKNNLINDTKIGGSVGDSPAARLHVADSATTLAVFESTDSGALSGPLVELYRNSASPAISDVVGTILFTGQDDGGAKSEYSRIDTLILDESAGTEDGRLRFSPFVGGGSVPMYQVDGTSGHIWRDSGNTEIMQLDDNGDLGLGNVTPLARLHVADSSVQSAYFESTDAGAGVGPVINLYRNSASPAVNDNIGTINFSGEDSGGSEVNYARISALVKVTTAGSEDADLRLQTMEAGTIAARMIIDNGIYTPNAVGGDQGIDSINAEQVYEDGASPPTDYVLDQYVDGAIDHAFYDSTPFANKSRDWNPADLDIADYERRWRERRALPPFMTKDEITANNRMSTGEMAQALLETAEVHAVHIAKLHGQIKLLWLVVIVLALFQVATFFVRREK